MSCKYRSKEKLKTANHNENYLDSKTPQDTDPRQRTETKSFGSQCVMRSLTTLFHG
jgi:hypothetical protein